MKINRSRRNWSVKKALLIGITYRSEDPQFSLPGTVIEVAKFRDLLIGESTPSDFWSIVFDCPKEYFGYCSEDIVMMSDVEGVAPQLQPTKTNIVCTLNSSQLWPVVLKYFLVERDSPSCCRRTRW